jgi:hypothetical protein
VSNHNRLSPYKLYLKVLGVVFVCFWGVLPFLVSWLFGFVVWFLGGLIVLFFKYFVYFN